jgi:hypothetical protein
MALLASLSSCRVEGIAHVTSVSAGAAAAAAARFLGAQQALMVDLGSLPSFRVAALCALRVRLLLLCRIITSRKH